MTIARVAVDVPLDTLFDYRVPEGERPMIGARVQVPLGSRKPAGVVVETSEATDIPGEKLRPLLRVFDEPPLPADVLELLRFCSRYYHHPIGEVVMGALPPAYREGKPVADGRARELRLTPAGRAARVADLPPRALALRRVLAALQARGGTLPRSEVSALAHRAKDTIAALLERGWAEEGLAATAPDDDADPPPDAPPLSPAQHEAVQQLLAAGGRFGAFLLHGVTGSGKTEVYLAAAQRCIAGGGQVLVLVPEINLTPQLESRVRSRFAGREIAVLHSGLSSTERSRGWQAAARGDAQVVLGTRLAVFTPMPRLALIVVDEEHDASYKQQEGLRYSARDVAMVRARESAIPIVLGSATPSLESYHNARSGRYRLLELPARAPGDAELPRIRLVDLRRERARLPLSRDLVDALEQCLARGEQSLVFINRRGYAPVLFCASCGFVAGCGRCSARLVYHATARRLVCHHCGHAESVPAACPSCGDPDLKPLGHGTQRVEQALEETLPGARILRVDSDTTRRRDAWLAMLGRIRRGAVDVLVGTQMLAKGHDFPMLTLVGVVNADASLYSTDYRAAERLFAQLMQVAGRAGRASLPGEVLVQTEFPAHPLYQALARHDYAAFAGQLLDERREARFPPFVHESLLRAESHTPGASLEFLRAAAQAAAPLAEGVAVFDPVPALMSKVAGRERAQLLLQSDSRARMQRLLDAWVPQLPRLASRRVRYALDVDPLDF